MALPDVTVAQIAALVPEFAEFALEIQQQTATDALYAQYVERQKHEISALKREESAEIPNGFVFIGLPGLSTELGAKLSHVRPANLAQAARIEGMTPAALTLILAHIRKARREVASQ
jgi:tRNA uridine 5-carboxymethylaminomethyl modification enzyme